MVADRSQDGHSRTSPRGRAREVDLTVARRGSATVMGSDQDHIDRIFLPGQADCTISTSLRSTGTVTVGDQTWSARSTAAAARTTRGARATGTPRSTCAG